ncbi:MAG: HEAT repeat domain-containing protein [Bacteroidia bacterium]
MTIKLSDIYSNYLHAKTRQFGRQDVLSIFWDSHKQYKYDILQMLDSAIADKDVEKLSFCIGASFRDGLDQDYSDKIYKIMLDTWHEEHEDLVDIIIILKDDRFCDSLLRIALDQETYRKFDDENESTLRKCVHALKAINSKRSLDLLAKLIETENSNVQFALEMYK